MILDTCFEIPKLQDSILNFQILFNIINIELKMSKHTRITCLRSVAPKVEDTALIWMLTSAKNKKSLQMQNVIVRKYTYLQNKRMRRCGEAPPPIIFERLKLPQQIIYRRKENLSESPNHQKYWENILVSRFYEQFSRNRRNLGHFWKFEKISNS